MESNKRDPKKRLCEIISFAQSFAVILILLYILLGFFNDFFHFVKMVFNFFNKL